MKIAVNLLPFRRKIAGAGKYAKKILQELSEIDKNNQYYLFVTEEGKKNFEVYGSNFHFIIAKFNPDHFIYRIIWEQVVFPFKLKKLLPNIIFTPSVAVPLFYRGRFYTTIHDLAYKKSANKYSFFRRNYLDKITRVAIKKSEVIFTVSNFSKKEIENEFNTLNKKILITHNGVDEIFFKSFSDEEILEIKNRYNLPENYILYVGAIEPSKNLDKLLPAFSELIKEYNLDYYLAITSGIGWNQQFLTKLIRSLNIKEKIIFFPYIPEPDLPIIYRCSKMLTYLSNYEGFGNPVLEAIASGTPVLTSKSEAIKEFSEGLVVSVDLFNIGDIVEGMTKIINNRNFINAMTGKARTKAKKFRWRNSAKVIYDQFNLTNE